MLLIGVGVCSVGYFFAGLALIETFCMLPNGFSNTGNDRYSGDPFSGNDGFCGTKPPDDAILFTVSGITGLVE